MREELLKSLLNKIEADGIHLVLIDEERSLTRFTGNFIHENINMKDSTLIVKLIRGRKVGVAVTHDLEERAIESFIKKAIEVTDSMPELEDVAPLPTPKPHKELKGFYEATYEQTPKERAESVKRALDYLEKKHSEGSGAYDRRIRTTYVATSTGIMKSFRETLAHFHIIAETDKGSSGWAQMLTRNVDDIDTLKVTEVAYKKARTGEKKKDLKAGPVDVLLESNAVSEFIVFLSFMGFGARTYLERRSFMFGKIGGKITGDNITIVDDALDPRTAGMPFDYEGVPKKRVVLIDHGVAKGIVTDTYYAKKLGMESTGHALRPDNTYGPYPKNLILETGDKTYEELVQSMERGVIVTRLWYLNFLNPARTMVTGTTRNGTLLVENGKIVGGVEDMRFDESILDMLSRVVAISKEGSLNSAHGTHIYTPSVIVKKFNFKGV